MLQWMQLFQEHVLSHVTMDAVVSGTCGHPGCGWGGGGHTFGHGGQ